MTNLTETKKEDLLVELGTIRRKRSESKQKLLFSSKLDRYQRELVRLAGEGASLADLKTWLAAKGVKAGRSTIWMAVRGNRPSKLDQYRSSLVDLAEMGASLAELEAWLDARGVQTNKQAIWTALWRWERDQEEPHFLSPGWKQKGRSARSGEPAPKNRTTPSSHSNQ